MMMMTIQTKVIQAHNIRRTKNKSVMATNISIQPNTQLYASILVLFPFSFLHGISPESSVVQQKIKRFYVFVYLLRAQQVNHLYYAYPTRKREASHCFQCFSSNFFSLLSILFYQQQHHSLQIKRKLIRLSNKNKTQLCSFVSGTKVCVHIKHPSCMYIYISYRFFCPLEITAEVAEINKKQEKTQLFLLTAQFALEMETLRSQHSSSVAYNQHKQKRETNDT